jgi:hypothetical protein
VDVDIDCVDVDVDVGVEVCVYIVVELVMSLKHLKGNLILVYTDELD